MFSLILVTAIRSTSIQLKQKHWTLLQPDQVYYSSGVRFPARLEWTLDLFVLAWVCCVWCCVCPCSNVLNVIYVFHVSLLNMITLRPYIINIDKHHSQSRIQDCTVTRVNFLSTPVAEITKILEYIHNWNLLFFATCDICVRHHRTSLGNRRVGCLKKYDGVVTVIDLFHAWDGPPSWSLAGCHMTITSGCQFPEEVRWYPRNVASCYLH